MRCSCWIRCALPALRAFWLRSAISALWAFHAASPRGDDPPLTGVSFGSVMCSFLTGPNGCRPREGAGTSSTRKWNVLHNHTPREGISPTLAARTAMIAVFDRGAGGAAGDAKLWEAVRDAFAVMTRGRRPPAVT